MAKNKTKPEEFPASQEIRREINRTEYYKRYRKIIKSTLFSLITVAAIGVLVATLLFPVFQIYGTSMSPTLADGEIAIGLKTHNFETGDIVAFYLNNKILIKRVIAGPGDWVDIDPQGNVFVNKQPIDEPYVTERAFGDCDLDLPYQVPESRYFVMGDHRSVSLDSRNTVIGCIAEEQIVGTISFKIWPVASFGPVQ